MPNSNMDTAGRRYTFPFKSKIYKKNCTPPFMNYKLVWQIQYNTKQTALSTSERIFLKLNNGGEIGTISSGLLFPPKKQRVSRCFFGGDNEIRTRGLCVANAALYQLSHIPTAMNLEIQAHRFHCAPKKIYEVKIFGKRSNLRLRRGFLVFAKTRKRRRVATRWWEQQGSNL